MKHVGAIPQSVSREYIAASRAVTYGTVAAGGLLLLTVMTDQMIFFVFGVIVGLLLAFVTYQSYLAATD